MGNSKSLSAVLFCRQYNHNFKKLLNKDLKFRNFYGAFFKNLIYYQAHYSLLTIKINCSIEPYEPCLGFFFILVAFLQELPRLRLAVRLSFATSPSTIVVVSIFWTLSFSSVLCMQPSEDGITVSWLLFSRQLESTSYAQFFFAKKSIFICQ